VAKRACGWEGVGRAAAAAEDRAMVGAVAKAVAAALAAVGRARAGAGW